MGKRQRPIRFGTGGGRVADRDRLVSAARRAEDIGYSTFSMADHLGLPLAPLIALQAVADATTTLRITQTVLAHDFHRPAVLAKELATLDVLSDGRVEVGVGAGWMRSEYDQAGIRFDSAAVRIARLEEFVLVLKGLFGEQPFSFSGTHFSIRDLDGTPKPLQRPTLRFSSAEAGGSCWPSPPDGPNRPGDATDPAARAAGGRSRIHRGDVRDQDRTHQSRCRRAVSGYRARHSVAARDDRRPAVLVGTDHRESGRRIVEADHAQR